MQLRALRVRDPTLCKYKEEVDKFLTVAANRRWNLKSDSKTDEHLSVYFADLFEEGATYNTASYTLFGYILLKSDSDQPERTLYPRARQALKGWSSKCPQSSRTGADPQIWFLLASHIADHSPPMAAALLLQLDTCTRPVKSCLSVFGASFGLCPRPAAIGVSSLAIRSLARKPKQGYKTTQCC